MTKANPDTVITRFTFKPDSADHFLFKEDVEQGRLVQERDDLTIDEAAEFIQAFSSSLDDAQIFINNSVVVSLSDFIEEADEADLIDW